MRYCGVIIFSTFILDGVSSEFECTSSHNFPHFFFVLVFYHVLVAFNFKKKKKKGSFERRFFREKAENCVRTHEQLRLFALRARRIFARRARATHAARMGALAAYGSSSGSDVESGGSARPDHMAAGPPPSASDAMSDGGL